MVTDYQAESLEKTVVVRARGFSHEALHMGIDHHIAQRDWCG
jgi:hypothetical protein